MTDDQRALAAISAGAAGLAVTLLLWLELMVRRPLAGIGVLLVGILVVTGIVTYDLQSERPAEQPNGR